RRSTRLRRARHYRLRSIHRRPRSSTCLYHPNRRPERVRRRAAGAQREGVPRPAGSAGAGYWRRDRAWEAFWEPWSGSTCRRRGWGRGRRRRGIARHLIAAGIHALGIGDVVALLKRILVVAGRAGRDRGAAEGSAGRTNGGTLAAADGGPQPGTQDRRE